MKTAIIIPTYNEKVNIQEIISKIFSLNLENLHIIVVDDNSPDGTGKLVDAMKLNDQRIHVIHREKKMGLGTAYLEGFEYALKKGAEYLFEIDADFSHDACLIPEFLKNIENHDLVVGSRYIPEGKIENWNILRRFFSKFGNIYSRFILNLPIKDLTTGFKCYRRDVIDSLLSRNINSVGYVFQIETTYYVYKDNFKIKEIPIVFTERRLGNSKFDFRIIWESFWKVIKIRFKS
jgi:dolichol-phosphate mannosyltransferase